LLPVLPLQPKDWSIDMNKKERRLALATALQSAAGDVVVVDDIKQAAGTLVLRSCRCSEECVCAMFEGQQRLLPAAEAQGGGLQ
jgi:ribosomal protein L4